MCVCLLSEMSACKYMPISTIITLLPLPLLPLPSPPLPSSSRVLPDKKAAVDAAMSLASDIASKSPVAVFGTKHNLIYSRDHSVADGLEYAVSAVGVSQ